MEFKLSCCWASEGRLNVVKLCPSRSQRFAETATELVSKSARRTCNSWPNVRPQNVSASGLHGYWMVGRDGRMVEEMVHEG